ncbi:MAG: hypothetical protein FWG44_04470 [Oscillospiraceae bacterium]|nr:hypothetical protein [Oscillospiraceae bacterium]
MINVYDKVKLKTGIVGRILEILNDDSFIVELYLENGDIDTTEIKKLEIKSVFEEVERPIA